MRAPIYVSALVALSCLGAVAASVEKRAPRTPYDTAFALWAGGRQADAEEFLMQSLNRSPRDQGVLFFLASCFRSRFEVDISLKAMAMVEGIDPATPRGPGGRADQRARPAAAGGAGGVVVSGTREHAVRPRALRGGRPGVRHRDPVVAEKARRERRQQDARLAE